MKNILVIEDNAMVAKLYATCLGSLKHRVYQAADAGTALDLARRQPPDLVILDIVLPGVSGLELPRILRGEAGLAEVPILAVTTLSAAGEEARLKAAGCDAYLSKPIQIPAFLAAVQRLLALETSR